MQVVYTAFLLSVMIFFKIIKSFVIIKNSPLLTVKFTTKKVYKLQPKQILVMLQLEGYLVRMKNLQFKTNDGFTFNDIMSIDTLKNVC